jgi:meiotically up-regulated gene 157 (Mug157) protein
MNRREFIRNASVVATAAAALPSSGWAATETFPTVRVPPQRRKFQSAVVERVIQEVQDAMGNRELAWMFGNCFPNTLDTTVEFKTHHGRPDTYVITGDIDAMWLRDSTAQVWPYIPLAGEDAGLRQMLAGVIHRQTACIHKDPYANAFYKDDARVGEWKDDRTAMQPGVHERKWEIDSLCYPIRLAYHFWKTTGDGRPFDADWRQAIALTLRTFREQQRKTGDGPYSFMRRSEIPTDSLPGYGYGRPAQPVGLIFSMFRPSDDATVFPLLVPSNFFAVVSLRQAAEMVETLQGDGELALKCRALADEVEAALGQYAVVNHPKAGRILAFEVDGYGSHYCMDDANVPNLLSLPYLGAVDAGDPLYQATRQFVLSGRNPHYYHGTAAEGLGGPHAGRNMIWPLGITLRALTSTDDEEIRLCLDTLQRTHAGTGFMHEAFHKDNPAKFTRKWFAWANTLFGELILKVHRERPHLLR